MPYTVMTRGLLFDTNRVEILKGPQGDLYRRNTTAGQINFISNSPTENFEAGVTASIGSYQASDVEAFVSGPLSDSSRGRLAARYVKSNEGWQKSTVGDDELGRDDVLALRGIIETDHTEALSTKLIISYVDDQSENTANTAYDGRDIGLGQFIAPHLPLNQYVIPGGANFGETPPFYSSGDNERAGWTNSYTSPITGKTFDLRPQRDNQTTNVALRIDWDLGSATLTSISLATAIFSARKPTIGTAATTTTPVTSIRLT